MPLIREAFPPTCLLLLLQPSYAVKQEGSSRVEISRELALSRNYNKDGVILVVH
jgi:hypothetical protein